MSEAPSADRWRAKQAHYQDPAVAREYDARRFAGARKSGDTARFWRAIEQGLGPELARVHSVLDTPGGTGRFAAFAAREGRSCVLADLSHAMLAQAHTSGVPRVQADALALPFADASFDLVLCMRFLFHVPRELQPRVLAELARVSRRFVAVDVRHGCAWSAWTRALRGKLLARAAAPRMRPAEIDPLFAAAGLAVSGKRWFAPGFSEKVLVLAEKQVP
ncbi:MAG: class I SAM-dependent methyltransferase [Planctomycetes bacterium]|nr:class I SAM-dependent methyltransferase [Planctomycetota bacterium]